MRSDQRSTWLIHKQLGTKSKSGGALRVKFNKTLDLRKSAWNFSSELIIQFPTPLLYKWYFRNKLTEILNETNYFIKESSLIVNFDINGLYERWIKSWGLKIQESYSNLSKYEYLKKNFKYCTRWYAYNYISYLMKLH